MSFRTAAHTALDEILDAFPDTSALLIAVDGKNLEAISVPAALSVKRGLIDSLYDVIHPEVSE